MSHTARATTHKYGELRVPPGRRVYQAYFHTSRGGCGIEYAAARYEFGVVMRPLGMDVQDETPAHMRVQFSLPADAESPMVDRAPLLGYTEAIVRCSPTPFTGQPYRVRKAGRWLVGTQRWRAQLVEFTEVYVEDARASLANAPHRRPFLIARDGQTVSVKGERLRRRLSHRDARFLVNIAQLPSAATVLDPFAGIGSIILECRARDVRVVGGDIEETLRPGLAKVADGRAGVLDARWLPFADRSFDAVIAEPPYHRDHYAAVLASIPELARVAAPGGCVVLLVAQNMHEPVLRFAAEADLAAEREFSVRRQGKLLAKALLLRKP
jgi:16S rRNA G966 N2-methylase RsmD